jgi:hypothetical protein
MRLGRETRRARIEHREHAVNHLTRQIIQPLIICVFCVHQSAFALNLSSHRGEGQTFIAARILGHSELCDHQPFPHPMLQLRMWQLPGKEDAGMRVSGHRWLVALSALSCVWAQLCSKPAPAVTVAVTPLEAVLHAGKVCFYSPTPEALIRSEPLENLIKPYPMDLFLIDDRRTLHATVRRPLPVRPDDCLVYDDIFGQPSGSLRPGISYEVEMAVDFGRFSGQYRGRFCVRKLEHGQIALAKPGRDSCRR